MDSYLVGVQENLCEREEQVEEEPHVNHLDVGGLGQLVAHVDEHCCQDLRKKQRRHICIKSSLSRAINQNSNIPT